MTLLKGGVGLVLAFLIGCETRVTAVDAPDTASNPDGTLVANVGETHLIEAYTVAYESMDTQSFDCDPEGATVTSSDPSILSVGIARFDDTDETLTGESVVAMVALYHAIAPGTATITMTCDDRASGRTILVKP